MPDFPLEQFEKINPSISIKFEGRDLCYHTPNRMTKWRVDSFFTKEPDTIRWISCMTDEEILLDVGANVGMYTIMASVGRGLKVFAFEPESQNYSLLNRNIYLNGVSDLVTAYCAGLSDHSGLDKFYLSNFSLGGSCHAVGESLDFNLIPQQADYVQGCTVYTLDEMIESNAIPVPTHIKIDVDGFEHKVITGMQKTLTKPEVKSVLIELNPHLEEHRGLFQKMEELGYRYFESQAEQSRQPDGVFAGIGNVIFYRKGWAAYEDLYGKQKGTVLVKASFNHVMEKIKQAEIISDPTPHFFIENVFPDNFYQNLLTFLPDETSYIPINMTEKTKGHYSPLRSILAFDNESLSKLDGTIRPFWNLMANQLLSPDLIFALVDKFSHWLPEAGAQKEDLAMLHREAMLIRDIKKYELGPHTDTHDRVASLFFYLPKDHSLESAGTALYKPLDENFHSDGSRHLSFEDFSEVDRFPFKPNSLIGFVRTDTSYHGVPRFDQGDEVRNILGYAVKNLKRTR